MSGGKQRRERLRTVVRPRVFYHLVPARNSEEDEELAAPTIQIFGAGPYPFGGAFLSSAVLPLPIGAGGILGCRTPRSFLLGFRRRRGIDVTSSGVPHGRAASRESYVDAGLSRCNDITVDNTSLSRILKAFSTLRELQI